MIISTLAACDPGMIPNRNVRDVSTEVVRLADEVAAVSFSNPNNVRVGAQVRVRIFEDGRREPIHSYVAHAYVPPQMGTELPIELASWCGGDDAPACASLRPHAVLLETYWLSDQ